MVFIHVSSDIRQPLNNKITFQTFSCSFEHLMLTFFFIGTYLYMSFQILFPIKCPKTFGTLKFSILLDVRMIEFYLNNPTCVCFTLQLIIINL